MSERLNPLEEIEEPPERPRSRWRWSLGLSLLGLAALLGFQHRLLGSWIEREARVPRAGEAAQLRLAWTARSGAAADLPAPPHYYRSVARAMGRGEPSVSALRVNFAWLALLILAVWGLGLLYAGDWEALGAAVLLSCAPAVQGLARSRLPDLAVTAWVAAAYFACAWSAGFLRWTGSLLFGGCLGFALMTSAHAWTYMLPLAWPVGRALSGRVTRWRALAALVAAAAVSLPWYSGHLSALLGGAAESLRGAPFWKGTAASTYIGLLGHGLDAPLFALGFVALVVPTLRRGREDNWLIHAWFLFAFALWTLIPDRQLRFLVPAMAPLALLVPGSVPRSLAAILCVWQLASAANYSHEWVRPIRFDVGPGITFLSASPPAAEDWKVAEIVRAAARRREPGLKVSRLAVAADEARFGRPVLEWELARGGIDGFQVREIGRRGCELAEFALIKTGTLADRSLQAWRDRLLEQGSWFLRAYQEVGRWSLPDESEAVLYQRRRRAEPPVPGEALRLELLETPDFAARGLSLRLEGWDGERSAYRRARFEAMGLTVGGLELGPVAGSLDGVDFVAVRDAAGRVVDLRLLRLERATLESAALEAESVAAFLAARSPALAALAVRLDGTAGISGRLYDRVSVGAEASLRLEPGAVEARLLNASLGPLRLAPPATLGTCRLPLDPGPLLPFELRIPGLTLKSGRLTIP
ncbi:MAG: hypothetical protein HY554_02300 [Elusimicrobia bacterium]|nr:hypothetical protein [Elusimicrobiota bacterium]